MWPFSRKKKKTGEIAKERMNSFVRGTSGAAVIERGQTIKLENSSDEEINSIVTYIKDYAYRNLSVDKKNVKVHISKEGNSVTIVASIIYK
jgi:hypothetical protein